LGLIRKIDKIVDADIKYDNEAKYMDDVDNPVVDRPLILCDQYNLGKLFEGKEKRMQNGEVQIRKK
jgi:hypothetical protein